jgi:hypothetical protein
VVFKDLQKLVQQSQQQQENKHNELFQRLQGKPFWIWILKSISNKTLELTEIAAFTTEGWT